MINNETVELNLEGVHVEDMALKIMETRLKIVDRETKKILGERMYNLLFKLRKHPKLLHFVGGLFGITTEMAVFGLNETYIIKRYGKIIGKFSLMMNFINENDKQNLN